MKLLYYELIKLKKNNFLLTLFAILLLLNGIFIFRRANSVSTSMPSTSDITSVFETYYSDPQKIYRAYDKYLEIKAENDKILAESIKNDTAPPSIPYEKVLSDDPNFSDSYFYSILFAEIDKITAYPETVKNIIKTAENLIEEYQNMGISEDSYAIQYQRKAIENYTKALNSVRFGLEYVHGWDLLLSHTLDNLFIFILLIAISVFSFVHEHETGMHHILNVSRFGRGRTAAAKLLSVLICIVLIVAAFTIENCLIIGVNIGFSNPENAIQIIRDLYLCPWVLTIGEYFILSLFLKIFTYLLFSLLVIAIGLLTRSSLYTFIGGGIVYVLNLVPGWIAPNNPRLFVKKINLINASTVMPLFEKFETVNCFGVVTKCSSFTIAGLSILVPLLFASIIVLYARNLHFHLPRIRITIPTLRSRIQSPPRTLKPHSAPLLLWELKKVIGHAVVLLVILGCIILKASISANTYAPVSSNTEILYHSYMTHLAGEITDEKRAYVAEEREFIQTTLSQYSKYKEDYAKGKITQQEYREYLILYGEAYVKNEPFKRIEQHLSYADELSAQGREAWFVYDTGWKTFLNADFDWPLYVLQLLLFSGVFIIEHASRSSNGAFHTILRTTKNGRSVTFKWKILSTAALSTVLYGIFLSIDLFYLSSGFDLPLPQAPLHSLPFMSASVPGVSIKAFCILYAAARLLANIAFSIFVVTISSLIKKLTPALTVITFITLMPHLLSRSGFHALSCVDYTAVLRFTPLLLDNLPVLIFALLFSVCTLSITICARRRWIH